MQEGGLDDLQRRIEGDFHHKNLREMAKCCFSMKDDKIVTGYVLGNMFEELAAELNGVSYETDIENIGNKYRQPVSELLKEISAECTPERELALLSQIILMHIS